jgi:hypothetical protein
VALVAHRVGHVVELAVVGDELGGPPTTGRAAEPGLDAGLQEPGDEVGVVVAVAGRRAVERQRESAGGVPQHRFDHDPAL